MAEEAKNVNICECGHSFYDHSVFTESKVGCDKCNCKQNPVTFALDRLSLAEGLLAEASIWVEKAWLENAPVDGLDERISAFLSHVDKEKP